MKTIAEQGFRNVLVLSDDSPLSFMLTRWISLVIIAMIILAIYFSLRPKAWEKTAEASQESSETGDAAEVEQSADNVR